MREQGIVASGKHMNKMRHLNPLKNAPYPMQFGVNPMSGMEPI